MITFSGFQFLCHKNTEETELISKAGCSISLKYSDNCYLSLHFITKHYTTTNYNNKKNCIYSLKVTNMGGYTLIGRAGLSIIYGRMEKHNNLQSVVWEREPELDQNLYTLQWMTEAMVYAGYKESH